MTKTFYTFDSDTGRCTGIYEAQESPLEPGVFIAPICSTLIAPPIVSGLQEKFFDGEKWKVVAIPQPDPVIETQAEIIKKYEMALDSHLDTVARVYRYDNRFTFSIRAGYVGPYQAEAILFAQWMDLCNTTAYALMADVVAGSKEMPTIDDFIGGLPVFVLL